ncbi:MAG: hypothetical protein RI949_37 [Pseudomonadota bacterium]|jgi:outer membrane lipoprotein LolB
MMRRMKQAWMRVALAVSLLTTGCVSPRVQEAGTLQGRLALRVAATAALPERQLSALFALGGNASQGFLELSTPLGLTLATAKWQPGRVELRTPQESMVLDDLNALAQRTLGEPMPLGAVFAWLRGRAWDQAPYEVTEGNAREPLTFEQLGWKVDLRRFAQGVLTAQRPGEPAVTLQARWDRHP